MNTKKSERDQRQFEKKKGIILLQTVGSDVDQIQGQDQDQDPSFFLSRHLECLGNGSNEASLRSVGNPQKHVGFVLNYLLMKIGQTCSKPPAA